jgi:hypothetical protein
VVTGTDVGAAGGADVVGEPPGAALDPVVYDPGALDEVAPKVVGDPPTAPPPAEPTVAAVSTEATSPSTVPLDACASATPPPLSTAAAAAAAATRRTRAPVIRDRAIPVLIVPAFPVPVSVSLLPVALRSVPALFLIASRP